jgi:hypothetical protein
MLGEQAELLVEEVWLGGTRLLPEAKMAAELKARYGKPAAARARR